MTSAPGRARAKSQLYHYFPEGREQLLIAVARYEADLVLSDQQPQLGNLTSWAAWLAWRDTVLARYREQGQQCPLMQAAGEISRDLDATRTAAAILAGVQGGVGMADGKVRGTL
jgi:hypothetical protein